MPGPKKVTINIDEQLFRHLGNVPDGLRTDQLFALLGDAISRRSLQTAFSRTRKSRKVDHSRRREINSLSVADFYFQSFGGGELCSLVTVRG